MNQQILQDLIELQEIDCNIYRLEYQKQQKSTVLQEKQREIDQKRHELEACKEELKKVRIEVDKKDLALKEKEEKVTRLNIQLNTVKTNKEYAAFMAEITGLKADISVLEDEILSFFSQIEEFQKKAQKISEEVTLAEKELIQLKEKVEAETSALEKELALKRERRRQLTEKIPPDILSTYNKIIIHKSDKIALAAVTDGVCQGCFIDISPQEINELLKGREIVYCRSCSRMLYLKPPEK